MFQPEVKVQADETISVRLLLPRPHQDRAQEFVRLFGLSEEWSIQDLFDQTKANQLIDAEIKVGPGSPAEFSYSAVVRIRATALAPAARPPASRSARLTSAEWRRTKRYLKLTSSTGLDREDLSLLAAKFAKDDVDSLRVARRIYDAVIDRLEYRRMQTFKGAGRCWDERSGECCDYAALFVALCRSAGIPARSVCGFQFVDGRWDLHVWAEFYVQQIGWTPCDPSLGDAGPGAADHYFAAQPANRLALTRDFDLEFDDELIQDPAILQEYLYVYRGQSKPRIEWRIEGKRLGASMPEAYRELPPPPKRFGRRRRR